MKGSPYPRSYYKCSHAGCNVKKIVERDPKTGEVSSAIAKVASTAISCTPAHIHLLQAQSHQCVNPDALLSLQGGHNHTKPNSRPSSGSMHTRGTGRAGRGGRATRGRAGRVSHDLLHVAYANGICLHCLRHKSQCLTCLAAATTCYGWYWMLAIALTSLALTGLFLGSKLQQRHECRDEAEGGRSLRGSHPSALV